MAESIRYLIFQNREKEFCDLIEELWTYRLMPDFDFQIEQLKRGDFDERRVGMILSDKAKTRVNCPCCKRVTSSRFIEQLECEGEPSALCYLCEMCGNVIRMRPLAVELCSTLATSDEVTFAGLQVRSPRPPKPDLMEKLRSQLSVRGQNLLDIERLTTIEQLCHVTVEEFCELRIVNSKLYEEFRERLACFGRSLVGDEEFLRDYVTHHFLNAIYDSPEVDEPRLAYAAWLEKNEIPLGEFIRTQVELAKLDESEPEFSQLQQRESELLAYYRWQWLDDQGLNTGFATANFCRGFVETAAVDPQRNDIDGVGRLLQRHPLIWNLRFACNSSRLHEQIDFEYDTKDYYADILCQPWMSQI